jgi:hypothetical protein
MKFKDLKVGEVLSETQFYTVDKTSGKRVQLTNDLGEKIVVDNKYAESCLTSSQQYDESKVVTRTVMADLFISSTRIAITVNFNKQIKPADVKKALHSLYPNKGGIVSQAQFKKDVNKAVDLKGEERTMVGRHYGGVDEFGRVSFVDMKAVRKAGADYDTRLRLVDPRTLNWAIINGIKYTIKK